MSETRGPGSIMGGRYVLDRKLGEGAFGEVWAARDPRAFDRPVAIKVLLDEHVGNKDVVTRFHREGKATASLQHPNVVALLEYGDHDGIPFIVSELVKGRSLRAYMMTLEEAHTVLPLEDAMVIFRQICAAVTAAHAKGIIHRDLKPENVMIDGTGPTAHATVLDFGLARILSPDSTAAAGQKTETGRVMGSLKYMSPEQVLGDIDAIDARTDIFALTSVLHELLATNKAFEGDDYTAVVMQILTGPRPSPSRFRPELSSEIDDVFARGLAIKRDDRFASVGELLAAAEAAVVAPPGDVARRHAAAHPPAVIGPAGTGSRSLIRGTGEHTLPGVQENSIAQPPPRSSAGLILGVLGGFLVLGGGAAVLLTRSRPAAQPAPPTNLAADVIAAVAVDAAPPPPADVVLPDLPPADTAPWVAIAAPAAPVALGLDVGQAGSLSLSAGAHVSFAGPAFRIQANEVTFGDYERWARPRPERNVTPPAWVPQDAAARAEMPVVNVTWAHARQYCQALSGDLPTEEQWEYAARGPARRLNPWGAATPTVAQLPVWRGVDGQLGRVGSNAFDRSPEGVNDLGGNAEEWTASRYRTDDGALPEWTATLRVFRGLPLREARPAQFPPAGLYRNSGCTTECSPGEFTKLESIGFRCVRSADAPGAAAAPTPDQ